MKDYTFDSFREILLSFRSESYQILPFKDYISSNNSSGKYLILRHDVDRFPLQSLKMAQMEAGEDISSTFYFRIIPSVFKPEIIQKIASLGHEIGYHYEDLSFCKGNEEKSILHFGQSLEKLRGYYAVKTICMHGSPLSKWDNKTIWEKYNYKDFGIEADTSFDVDYNKVFYISDNGRAWNRTSVSIRDKVKSHFNIPIKSTRHLNSLVKSGQLPDIVMINAHPDTFFDYGIKWYLNYGYIEAKNLAKWLIVKFGLRK